jgi:hypothetical protein
MHDRPLAISRRTMGRMLLAAPAAVTLPQQKPEQKPPEKPPARPSELAEFIAAQESGLSPAERERLKKNVTETEQALAAIRDFKLPPDVAPALRFRALKSDRS